MKFEDVHKLVKGVPFIAESNARQLYNFIIQNKIHYCLELGFAHGVASCYIAAALDELGGGHLTSVDLLAAEAWQKPSIEELLDKTNLAKYVTIVREHTGYNWFLQKKILECTTNDICQPQYDLCVIDGPKNWTIDGFAFFLVDKLLKKQGWIIFDDYSWTYAESDKKRDSTDGVVHRELAQDERETPHIKQVFHLLVMQHPNYGNFKINKQSDWAWAQKVHVQAKKSNKLGLLRKFARNVLKN